MTHDLTYASRGRSGWVTVFCRRCRTVVFEATSAAEALIFVMDYREGAL
ncbi:hypothetical protein [Sediminicurvatus halobius]|nr:hypothetical protein [Spiribacter halobius]UEX76845.1 hypothetical protein LMH63_12855 [Spiribacter halobius]